MKRGGGGGAVVAAGGLVDVEAQRDGERVVLRAGEVQQRAEEVVPGPDEREDRAGDQGGFDQRQDDRPEDPDVSGPVDAGGFVHVAGHLPDELDEQEHEERFGGEELRQDQRDERVDQAEIVEQDVLRDDQHVERQQQGADHRGEQDPEALELDPGERVRGQG